MRQSSWIQFTFTRSSIHFGGKLLLNTLKKLQILLKLVIIFYTPTNKNILNTIESKRNVTCRVIFFSQNVFYQIREKNQEFDKSRLNSDNFDNCNVDYYWTNY